MTQCLVTMKKYSALQPLTVMAITTILKITMENGLTVSMFECL
jgi:hypothetical protein